MSNYEKPIVSTLPATHITSNSGKIHGEIHSVGDATDGILYQATFHLYKGIGSAYEWVGNYHFPNATTGLYSYIWEGLIPNEIYHYDFSGTYFKDPAYEYDPTYGDYYMSIVTGWGEQLSFITQEPIISENPLIHNTRLWNHDGLITARAGELGGVRAQLSTFVRQEFDMHHVGAIAIGNGFSNHVYVLGNQNYSPPTPVVHLFADGGNIYFDSLETILYGSLIVGNNKSSTVETPNYGKRLMYALETPTNYFCDIITTNLINGENWINIESMFAETMLSYIVLPSSIPYGYVTIDEKLKNKFKVSLYETEKAKINFLIYGKQKNRGEYMKEAKEEIFDDRKQEETIRTILEQS